MEGEQATFINGKLPPLTSLSAPACEAAEEQKREVLSPSNYRGEKRRDRGLQIHDLQGFADTEQGGGRENRGSPGAQRDRAPGELFAFFEAWPRHVAETPFRDSLFNWMHKKAEIPKQ